MKIANLGYSRLLDRVYQLMHKNNRNCNYKQEQWIRPRNCRLLLWSCRISYFRGRFNRWKWRLEVILKHGCRGYLRSVLMRWSQGWHRVWLLRIKRRGIVWRRKGWFLRGWCSRAKYRSWSTSICSNNNLVLRVKYWKIRKGNKTT